MNKNECKLLLTLLQEGSMSSFKSMTATVISQKSEFSPAKVRRDLNNFVEQGLVGLGYMKANAKTFFITEKGIDCLKQIVPKEIIDEAINNA